MAVGSRSADDYSFGDGGAGQLGTRGRRQPALYAAHVQLADAPVAALYDRRHPALFGAWRAGAPGIQPDGLSGRRQRFRLLFAFVGADSRLEERDARRAGRRRAGDGRFVGQRRARDDRPVRNAAVRPLGWSAGPDLGVGRDFDGRLSAFDRPLFGQRPGAAGHPARHRTGGVCADSGRCLLLTEGTVKKNRQKAPFYRHLSGSRESPAGDRSVVNRFFDKTGSGAF